MPITREQLEAKLAAYKQQQEQIQQQLILVTGAVQSTQQLLDEENKPEPAVEASITE